MKRKLNCETSISFTQKNKISITTSGSGTLTFKSGVSGAREYSVSGTQTTEIEKGRLTGESVNYFLSDGVYTTSVKMPEVLARLYSTTGSAAVWCIKNASGTVKNEIITFSSSNKDEKGYYKDLPDGYSLVRAATGISRIESVYDMIDFSDTSASTTAKNGQLTTTVSGTMTAGLYTVPTADNARITTGARGTIELTVAPKMDAEEGTITLKYGSNTGAQTISAKTTIRVTPSDMKKSGSNYYMDFDCANLVFLTAKLVDWEKELVPLPIPNLSSYVDFFVDDGGKPKYNSGLVVYGTGLTGGVETTTTYDSSLGYWVAEAADGAAAQNNNFYDIMPYLKNLSYFVVEDLSASASLFRHLVRRRWSQK